MCAKKLIAFLLIVVLALSMLSLNVAANEPDLPTYYPKDIETLIVDWKRALDGEEIKELSVNSTETYLIIPKINNLEVQDLSISVYDEGISFFYTNDDGSTIIRIWVYREKNSFPPNFKGLEIISEGKAVSGNTWYIDCATHAVSIQAKIDGEYNAIKDANELDNYFDFEVVDLTEKSPAWKVPLIVGSCAAVVAVAALSTLAVVKKKKSK